MIEVKTKLRKWGNSFGIVVPQKALVGSRLKEGDEVKIFMSNEKTNVLREMFGTLKSKKSTAQIMKEMDEELYDN